MEFSEFRRRYPERQEKIGRSTWGIIETRAPADAPVLLLLPGTLGTAGIFWNQLVELGDRIRMIAVTYPVIDEIGALADALAELVNHLKIRRASVLGSSLGGYLAQWFSAGRPERIEQIFIGNSLSDPKIVNPAGKLASELRRLPGDAHRRIVLGSVETWAEPEPIFATLKVVLRESGLRLIPAEALKARVLVVAGGGEVPPVDVPGERISIIDCEDDPLIGFEGRDDVVRRYPGAALVRLPTGGHYPYITRPEVYNGVIENRLLGGH